MSLFYFILKDGGEPVPDREGNEFPDKGAAYLYANTVAHELMRNREATTRFWRLEVRDDDLRPVSEVPFATIDDSICHLSPEYRRAIQKTCRNLGMLSDAIYEVRATLRQIKTTIARADEVMLSSPLGGHPR